jgi:hypothetical protein
MYLNTLETDSGWKKEEFRWIRKKFYSFLLRDGFLWRPPKDVDGVLLRIVRDENTKNKILQESHNVDAVGRQGVKGIYDGITGLY